MQEESKQASGQIKLPAAKVDFQISPPLPQELQQSGDLPNDLEEYTELKSDYKQVKKKLKHMRNDPSKEEEKE